MKNFTFEVKFCGPYIENILSCKSKLTKEEFSEVQDNFFEKVYNEKITALAFILDDEYYADYAIETNSLKEAISVLDTVLQSLAKEGCLSESISEINLNEYNL